MKTFEVLQNVCIFDKLHMYWRTFRNILMQRCIAVNILNGDAKVLVLSYLMMILYVISENVDKNIDIDIILRVDQKEVTQKRTFWATRTWVFVAVIKINSVELFVCEIGHQLHGCFESYLYFPENLWVGLQVIFWQENFRITKDSRVSHVNLFDNPRYVILSPLTSNWIPSFIWHRTFNKGHNLPEIIRSPNPVFRQPLPK